MSTDHGVAAHVSQAMQSAPALIEAAKAEQAQLDLTDPLTAEEMLEAREAVGPSASHLSVVQTARARRRGRPPGAKNRRTDNLVAYLSQFGPDPAVAAMKIIATPEELMVERSQRTDPAKRRMTLAEAQQHRMRMIELMMPYFHGKKPAALDISFAGVSDLIIEGVTHSQAEIDVMDAEFMELDDGAPDGGAA